VKKTPKKVSIKASLVEEADALSNKTLEKRILEALEEAPPKIPWVKEIEAVTVR
jgi:DNA-binding protein YbaB